MGLFGWGKNNGPKDGLSKDTGYVPDANMTGAQQGEVSAHRMGAHAGGENGNYQDLVDATSPEGNPQWEPETDTQNNPTDQNLPPAGQ